MRNNRERERERETKTTHKEVKRAPEQQTLLSQQESMSDRAGVTEQKFNLIVQKLNGVQKLQNQAAYWGPEYKKFVFWDPQNTFLEAKFFGF